MMRLLLPLRAWLVVMSSGLFMNKERFYGIVLSCQSVCLMIMILLHFYILVLSLIIHNSSIFPLSFMNSFLRIVTSHDNYITWECYGGVNNMLWQIVHHFILFISSFIIRCWCLWLIIYSNHLSSSYMYCRCIYLSNDTFHYRYFDDSSIDVHFSHLFVSCNLDDDIHLSSSIMKSWMYIYECIELDTFIVTSELLLSMAVILFRNR